MLLGGLAGCSGVDAEDLGAEMAYVDRADVAEYVEELVKDQGLAREFVREAVHAAKFRQDIIDKISRPAEKVWTWGRYRSHLVDDDRIEQGVAFWRAHDATLQRAAQAYGVAPEYVVAILGIETRYGRITGGYPVLDALFTLGFDYPPRSKFFRKELTEFLHLATEEGKDPSTIKGSYAGAMGYGQFISSSYRHYAVDFDDDGVRDIWANPVDAIGSIANYFVQHKWRGDEQVAMRVDVTTQAARDLLQIDLKLTRTVAEFAQAGIRLDDAGVPSDAKAGLFELTTQDGVEHWLVFHDFYVITRYNHSRLYAMAVYQLAQAIKARMAAAA